MYAGLQRKSAQYLSRDRIEDQHGVADFGVGEEFGADGHTRAEFDAVRRRERAFGQGQLSDFDAASDIDDGDGFSGNSYLQVSFEQSEVADICDATIGRESNLVGFEAYGDLDSAG